MKTMIGNVANNKAVPADYCATIENGAVVISDVNAKLLSAAQVKKILEMRVALVNKTVRVFDCSKFTVDAEANKNATVDANGRLTAYNADYIDVKGDDGKSNYVPDGNVVETDSETGITYFSESTKRSAPYFDLTIDGIELLDRIY